MVDGIMLVVAADSTSQQHLRRAEAILRQANGRLLGVLFNKVREYNNLYSEQLLHLQPSRNGASALRFAGLLGRGR
jgi:Mrp family chromosome partitioning ATPase